MNPRESNLIDTAYVTTDELHSISENGNDSHTVAVH